jgi:hypothetical protein
MKLPVSWVADQAKGAEESPRNAGPPRRALVVGSDHGRPSKVDPNDMADNDFVRIVRRSPRVEALLLVCVHEGGPSASVRGQSDVQEIPVFFATASAARASNPWRRGMVERHGDEGGFESRASWVSPRQAFDLPFRHELGEDVPSTQLAGPAAARPGSPTRYSASRCVGNPDPMRRPRQGSWCPWKRARDALGGLRSFREEPLRGYRARRRRLRLRRPLNPRRKWSIVEA